MRKFWALLAILLLLTGCGNASGGQTGTEPTAQPAAGEENRYVSFDIYGVNDLHGRLADSATQPGLDELTTYLKQAVGENAILLATGDMWQGTAEANRTKGAIITEWMNGVGFAAMTLGGHEFDWGEAAIRANRELAEFPFLGINVYSRETNARAAYCESSLLLERDGVQIGIIGAIGDCENSISASSLENVYFQTGDALTALVQAEAEALRSRGADFIIYALHDGYTETYDGTNALPVETEALSGYYGSVLSQGIVDLVFEADTHYSYVLRDSQGVYHLQAGANNSGIAHARVLVDRVSGEKWVLNTELIGAGQYQLEQPDPLPEKLLEKYKEQIGSVNGVLGQNETYRNNYALSELVAELYCQAGLARWGEAYDIVLAGGYISCRSPGYLPTGPVTYSQLQELLPFDNQISLCSIRGRDLVKRFLETDNEAYHIKLTEYGEAIREAIDPEGIYYLVTDSYTAEYSYNNLTVVDHYDEDVFARDLLAEHLA